MLPTQHRQEHLSLAYVRAVAAHAGWACSRPEDDYGVDLEVKSVARVGDRYVPTGHTLEVQVKSTSGPTFSGGELIYDLAVRNYNDLVATNRGSPLILVVYCMPVVSADWMRVATETSTLRHCGYWASLRGEAPSENQATQRVRIPTTQVFDAAALNTLMERLVRGEAP